MAHVPIGLDNSPLLAHPSATIGTRRALHVGQALSGPVGESPTIASHAREEATIQCFLLDLTSHLWSGFGDCYHAPTSCLQVQSPI
jgi:hypothetical protein